MNAISRRSLLRASAVAVPAVALAGCGVFGNMTPAQIVTQAQSIASGLSGMLTQLVAQYPTLIPAATVATIQDDLAKAQAAAKTLASGLPAATGASVVQTVLGYVNAVLNTLAAPPINGLIPAPFNQVVAAAAFLTPTLEAFVQSYIPAAAAASVTAETRLRFAGMAPGMTADRAVAVLNSYATR